jgi:hypothetical protein
MVCARKRGHAARRPLVRLTPCRSVADPRKIKTLQQPGRDLEAIEKYHLEVAGDVLADRIIDAILSQAEKIAALGIAFRPGMRGTMTKT